VHSAPVTDEQVKVVGLSVGEIKRAPILIDDKLYFVKLDAVRPVKIPTLMDAREIIRRQLQNASRREASSALDNQLIAGAVIQQ